MPYKNIVFAKLEKRLLEDPRWYMMSETSQLNYIKLILFAQQTYNQIPTNLVAIRKAFKTNQKLKTLERSLNEIQKAYKKFKKNGEFYCFEDFHEKTNYLKEFPSHSQVVPKEGVDIDKEKEKEKDTLYSYWNSCLTTPKLLEKEFIDELFQKHGFEKTKRLIREFKEGDFHRIKTMRAALNPDGTIKPKHNKNENATTVKWNPA